MVIKGSNTGQVNRAIPRAPKSATDSMIVKHVLNKLASFRDLNLLYLLKAF